jgi:predicted N-acetyltransferase YhbS
LDSGKRVGRLRLDAVTKHGEHWLKVAEVAVLSAYRRRGIASAMYRAALRAMDESFQGLLSYLPDRARELEKVYRRLGAMPHPASEDFETVRREA